MKRLALVILLALLTMFFLAVPPPKQIHASGTNNLFVDQSCTTSEQFSNFYQRYDGLRTLGSPISPAITRNGYSAQYFEKAVLEDHISDSDIDPNYRYMYGLLVDELHQSQSELPVGGDESSITYATIHTQADPSSRTTPPPSYPGQGIFRLNNGDVFVPFTSDLSIASGHVVFQRFWSYMNRDDLFPRGWLQDIGLPITPVLSAEVTKNLPEGAVQREIQIQAFQRTVLTYDPANAADWQVERANTGSDYQKAFPNFVVPCEGPQTGANISFTNPTTIDEAIALAQAHDVEALQIQHSFKVGTQTFTGLFPLPAGKSRSQIRSSWMEQYQRFLESSTETLNSVELGTIADPQARASFQAMSGEFTQGADTAADEFEYEVNSMVVEGNAANIEAMNASSLVEKIETAPTNLLEQLDNNQSLTPLSWINPEYWLPDYGGIITGYKPQYGDRHVNQYMWWDNTSGFQWDSTYEHDFFLNNYSQTSLGSGTYLSRAHTFWLEPAANYAASSLPAPYLDTRFSDPSAEPSYTIGSASAWAILPWVWYQNYIAVDNGDANQDNARLSGQRGHRSPSWCFSTWCSFSNQTEVIFGAWNIPVPSEVWWSK